MSSPSITLHKGDLAAGVTFTGSVAIDTETLGLNPHRDRLCLVQLSAGDGTAHLVQPDPATYDAPRLKALLTDASVTKIFHFARFDLAVLEKYLGVSVNPVYCTKIVSKLVRTYTDRHGLKDLTAELVGVELSKQQQSSDWAGRLKSAAARLRSLRCPAPARAQGKTRRHARAGRTRRLRKSCLRFSPRARSWIWPDTAKTTFSRIERVSSPRRP